MNKRVIGIVRTVAGIILIIIGISGIFLPILPGWILIFVGIELLGIQLVFVERIKRFVKERLDAQKKPK